MVLVNYFEISRVLYGFIVDDHVHDMREKAFGDLYTLKMRHKPTY